MEAGGVVSNYCSNPGKKKGTCDDDRERGQVRELERQTDLKCFRCRMDKIC